MRFELKEIHFIKSSKSEIEINVVVQYNNMIFQIIIMEAILKVG